MSTDLERYSVMMGKEFPKQYSFAISDTLNTMAFSSRENFRNKIADDVFDTKNNYVKSVVDFQRTKTRDIDSMHSEFGELEKKFGRKTTSQLTTHETGGVLKPVKNSRSNKKRKRLQDATQQGRGGTYRKPIRKAIAQADRLTPDIIKTAKTGYGKSIGLIAYAKRIAFKGLLVMHTPVNRVFGEFKVMGSKKKLKLKMVKNLETKKRVVKAEKWMEKSAKKPLEKQQVWYAENMDKQIAYLKKLYSI